MNKQYTREDQIAILEAVAAPLAPGQAKPDNHGLLHITARDVYDRLNTVCPADWEFHWEEVQTTQEGHYIVKGSLTIAGITRQEVGLGELKTTNKKPEGDELSFGGPHKAAVSGALKRCAVAFGFAIDLYKKDLAWKRNQQTTPRPDQQWVEPTPRPQNTPPQSPNTADEAHALIDNMLTIARGNKKLASPTEWVELDEKSRKRLHATIGDTFTDTEERKEFSMLIGFPASTNDMDRAQRSTLAELVTRRDAEKIVRLIIEAGPLFEE